MHPYSPKEIAESAELSDEKIFGRRGHGTRSGHTAAQIPNAKSHLLFILSEQKYTRKIQRREITAGAAMPTHRVNKN
jgi:hypothetical protein